MINFKEYLDEGKRGLWDNIHAKRKRIKAGSGEKMRKPGSKGAPTNADFKAANEEVVAKDSLNELSKDTLKSYAKKAVPDMQASQNKAKAEYSKAASAKDDETAKTHYDAANQAKDRTEKRMAGVTGAIKRFNKEELSADYVFNMLEEAAKAIDKGEYDYEGQMARTQLQTILRNSKDLVDMLSDDDNMPEWVQSKITLAQDYISSVRDYLQSREELEEQFDMIETVIEELALAEGLDSEFVWETLELVTDEELLEYAIDKKGHKSSTGGLTQKGVDAYNAKTGGNLQTAVTTPPSKLKPGSKAANRRKSFCARMGGVKGPMKDDKGRPTRKALALRKWNC